MTIALVLFLFHVHVSVLAVSRIRGNDANMVSLSEDLLFDLSKGQCYSIEDIVTSNVDKDSVFFRRPRRIHGSCVIRKGTGSGSGFL
mmetsp:Transcript_16344/g.37486  ORF Transcript_16344/g.37486 Transcript_16344/m.37486 type:complete len:87 (+) Transcript_16344:154-414(+)